MLKMELTEQEARLITLRRMTADQRQLTVLNARESARQAALAKMTEEQRTAAEAQHEAIITEQARVLALSPDERQAEMLVAQQAQLSARLDEVNTALEAPAIVAITGGMQSGKVMKSAPLGGAAKVGG